MKKRAAHFLLRADLSGSPPNEAVVRALMEAEYTIDIFAPEAAPDVRPYGSSAVGHSFSYGRRWMLRNVWSPRWRGYRVMSATAERPFALVGLLASLHGRRHFLLVDEIKAGSYLGNDPPGLKRRHIAAIRKSLFCIVNDEARVPLLRTYAGLGATAEIFVYPGCFREPPPPANREQVRAAWGIPAAALTIGVSGCFDATMGAEWLLDALAARSDLHVAAQVVNADAFTRILLQRVRGSERLFLQEERLSWREAWSTAAAVDIGLAIYRNPAPQFQAMGVSSNRLCMYLAMGVPVIASRQPSFGFLEKYDCGVLVEDGAEFAAAVETIAGRLDVMKRNALVCAKEYIDAAGRYRSLADRIAEL